VQAEATGILPASATLTISEPSADAGLARVCITSRSAGELLCITI
jgi:hypothetical protein